MPLQRQKSLRVLHAGTRSSRKRLSEQSPHLRYASGCIIPTNLVPTKPFTGKASEMVTTVPTFQTEKEKIIVTNKNRDSMVKKLKIEGIDAVGILNSIRPMSEPLKEIPRVENTRKTSESNDRRAALDIDEAQCLAYIKGSPISKQLETKRKKTESQNTASEQTIQSEVSTPDELTELTNPVKPPIQKLKEKKKGEALEQYRQTFLQVPKIDDRKPVFVSCDTRDRLDEIVRRLGGRKMSVSGLIENLALHHLALYGEDIERWRKL